MKLDNVKIGDKFFAGLYIYTDGFYGGFLKGLKIVECEVLKINPKTVAVGFSKDTRKRPQLMKKFKDHEALHNNKKDLIIGYLEFLPTTKFSLHVLDTMNSYLNRELKKLQRLNNEL